MPAIITRGAASAKGFGFAGKTGSIVYVEDVFSTYLYTGNGSTQTITNNIDLSTKGGMVWTKSRDMAYGHFLVHEAGTAGVYLQSDTTGAGVSGVSNRITTYSANGYSLGAGTINSTAESLVSWTFRKQPKFFDIVTYTGNATSGRQIAHSLGSAPGMIIVKRTDATRNWVCYHQALGNGSMMILNSTAAVDNASALWNNTTPTSTYFTVNNDLDVNGSGATYVAYLFAHDAGGFGLTGADNVISCGTFTTDGAGDGSVTLGYEPQWMLVKESSGIGSWSLLDNMRGLPAGSFSDALLSANLTTAEASTNVAKINATGASFTNYNPSATVIYIAIRRGPMKVPTDATKVFNYISRAGNNNTAQVTGVGFPPDLVISKSRTTTYVPAFYDKLRGPLLALRPSGTNAETSNAGSLTTFNQNGISVGDDASLAAINYSGTYINYFLERAPGFFDEVCYEGTGVARTVTHNLTVAPELVIIKNRGSAAGWSCGGNVLTTPTSNYLTLQSTAAMGSVANLWQTFSATTFGMGSGNPSDSSFNANTNTYVAYLFATCAGVSKVGTYTGNGSTQTIDCGLTAGARFVLIKRTDAVGDWYVYDTARGMTTLTDPYLLINSTAAEVATLGSVTTVATGFALNSAILAAINVSAGTYIFLAIA